MRYFKRESENVLQQLWTIKQTPEVNETQSWNVNYYTSKTDLPANWTELSEIRVDEFFKLATEYGVLSKKDSIIPTERILVEEHPTS